MPESVASHHTDLYLHIADRCLWQDRPQGGQYKRRHHISLLPVIFPGSTMERNFFHELFQHLQLLSATEADVLAGELYAGYIGSVITYHCMPGAEHERVWEERPAVRFGDLAIWRFGDLTI